MTEPQPTVFIVDDDEALRESLCLLVRSAGLGAHAYADAQAFLDEFSADRPGCVVADVRMPGISGLELQDRLNAVGLHPPLIIITGHADVPAAVRALKGGAVDFVEKPFDPQRLLDRIQEAIGRDAAAREAAAREATLLERMASLTPREREVMDHVVSGHANKVIAFDLDISERTVELHRARVMKKMRARSLAELVSMVQLLPPHPSSA
jgi:FixJ family two-component response regulator